MAAISQQNKALDSNPTTAPARNLEEFIEKINDKQLRQEVKELVNQAKEAGCRVEYTPPAGRGHKLEVFTPDGSSTVTGAKTIDAAAHQLRFLLKDTLDELKLVMPSPDNLK